MDEIIAQTAAEIPQAKSGKESAGSGRRLGAGEILLLVLGAPLWLSVLVAAAAVVLSLYVSLWALIVSAWAVFISVAACALSCVVASVIFPVGGHVTAGVAMLVAGIVCAGLSIFAFYGCKAATKGAVRLTELAAAGIRNCFRGKEAAA